MPLPVILDCSSSPFSHLKPVPIDAVEFKPGFWAERLQTIKQTTIPTQFELLEKTGRLDNFRRVRTKMDVPFQGYFFNDSDVYKWLEAACWSLAGDPDESTQNRIDEVIDVISNAQDQDGYLNTYFTAERKGERWTNLRDMHELYCAGHLIQAAIAHHRVTAQDNFLSVAVDLADHICGRFLDSETSGIPGHPEIEMALVELYRTLGDTRYLRMAQLFLDLRGYGVIGGRTYHLDHVPFRELERLEGHAVRAMYLCCGAADLFLETGEKKLMDTFENLWARMVSKQMYVTGGVGSRHEGEAFGNDFELPNARAYAETCAAIGSIMWNWRMLHALYGQASPEELQPEVKYADQIEWTLFNAVLPGLGLSGHDYHYVNPLETYEAHERQAWFDCACCPPNVARLIAGIGGYFYSRSENNIWIHQYASNTAEIQLKDDLSISLQTRTDYPWDGGVEIELTSILRAGIAVGKSDSIDSPVRFGVNIRIPNWLEESIPVYINNSLWREPGMPGSYMHLEREWKTGDKILFEFPLQINLIESHPYVYENSGRVAVRRGPILYCIEAYDNPNVNPRDVHLQINGDFIVQPMNILSHTVPGVHMSAGIKEIAGDWMDHLYSEKFVPSLVNKSDLQNVIAIPYFTWGNRSQGWMQVWISHERGIVPEKENISVLQ